MLTFQPARAEQYAELMELMMQEGDYLQDTLRLMKMTKDEFDRLFRSVGQVYCVYDDALLAGFYWVEEREKTLHLHGLVLKAQFQGKGIGTRILEKLVSEYQGKMKEMELGVHESNLRAIALYERSGFETVKTLADLKFRVMRRQVQSVEPLGRY